MITMYAVLNDEIVNRRFYKNNTVQTREHYISTLRKHFVGNYKILSLITEYRSKFVERNVLPYDDNFTFEIEEQFLDGMLISDTFFSFNFQINSRINLIILFPRDDYESRRIFVNEVLFYLKSYGYHYELQNYNRLINEFLHDDNEFMFVEMHKLSMRKEDD